MLKKRAIVLLKEILITKKERRKWLHSESTAKRTDPVSPRSGRALKLLC